MINLSKKTLLSLVACIAISSSAIAEDKVYAIVNGDSIKTSDIAVALRNPQVDFESMKKEQKDQILQNIIEQKVLAQEAYKSDIPNSAEYKEELGKLKQNLAYQIWIRDLSKTVQVKNEELKKYYNENKSKFKKPLELKASHILVSSEKEAKEIIKSLKKAKNIKSTFTQLAKDKSTGPSGANGGELGWFTKDKMVPAFSEATGKLVKGTFTKSPVKTQFGYHIIYLDDKKKSSTLKFDQVKLKLQQEFLQKLFVNRIKDKASKLIKKAKIEYK